MLPSIASASRLSSRSMTRAFSFRRLPERGVTSQDGSPRHVGGQHDAHERAAACRLLDREAAVERRRPLAEGVERGLAPLARAVVLDHQLDAAAVDVAEPDRDARRRAAPYGLRDSFADDLVEADLHLLAEALAAFDVEVDLEALLEADLLGERPDRGLEPLVPQHGRLDVEREVAQLADGRAMAVEGRREDRARLVDLPRVDRSERGVEHERDPGEVLDRAIVEEDSEAA